MGRRRKPPSLRMKDGCLVTDVYRPDGKRTTISFGPVNVRTQGQIYAAFGQWLDLYTQFPHRVLTYESPYEAIEQILNPAAIVQIGDFFGKYLAWLEESTPLLRDGRESPDIVKTRRLGRFLQPYKDWPVTEFGPDQLLKVRQAMINYRYHTTRRGNGKGAEKRYTRTGINQLTNRLHQMWRWGVGREITTEAQCQRLKEVKALRMGRTEAPETSKRSLVTEEEFRKVLDAVNPVVGDMIRLIWQTAMRPGEVCRMRPRDVIRDDETCWLYIPGREVSPVGDHKTAYRQRVRAIPLTGQAQQILRARIQDFDSGEAVFQPVDAVEAMVEEKFRHRKTPMNQGNRRGTNRVEHPMITPGKEYKTTSLNNAIKRACKQAGVERFTSYDLRRSSATRIRSRLDKEAARLLLGHVSTSTTDIYLLDEVREAMNVAKTLPEDIACMALLLNGLSEDERQVILRMLEGMTAR